MRESALLDHIARVTRDLPARHPAVLVGPGDDCAVVLSPGPALLLKVDQLVEGRHCRVGEDPDRIARKALARALSDIAAMAGAPAYALVAAAVPAGADAARTQAIFDAVHRWGEHFACPVVGGDICVTHPGAQLCLAITIIGRPATPRAGVTRDAARPGDLLYVTGRLGNAFASGRHLTFTPRLDEARALALALGPALHAMIDLSDGLGIDAARIAARSGVRIELDRAALPLHNDADPTRAPSDGEDYELLLCIDPAAHAPAHCPGTPTPLTRIGRVVAGSGCVLIEPDGSSTDAAAMGWDHVA